MSNTANQHKERREHARVPKYLTCTVFCGELVYGPTVTMDVSPRGLSVRVEEGLVPVGKEIHISLRDGGQSLLLRGTVVGNRPSLDRLSVRLDSDYRVDEAWSYAVAFTTEAAAP